MKNKFSHLDQCIDVYGGRELTFSQLHCPLPWKRLGILKNE